MTATAPQPGVAARHAAILFALAGAVAIVNAWIPGACPPDLRITFTLLGLADMCAAVLCVALPWRRWSFRALTAVPVVALVLIELFAIAGRLEPALSAVFLVALAAWTGVSLPRRSALRLAPAVAVAHLAPTVVAGGGVDRLATVVLVVPLFVAVAELLAHVVGDVRASNARLADAALRDELTGIGNRRQATAALERLQGGDAVLLLDLDHFKQVNDVHGHAAGDAVLASLGALLAGTVGAAGTVARLGGEEFVVVLRAPRVDARAVAERILRDWRGSRPATTLSIGVAVAGATEPADDVLRRADGSLYAAKRDGRDRVSVASRIAAAA